MCAAVLGGLSVLTDEVVFPDPVLNSAVRDVLGFGDGADPSGMFRSCLLHSRRKLHLVCRDTTLKCQKARVDPV